MRTNKAQSTYNAWSGNRTRVTSVEGERSLYCALPAPPKNTLISPPPPPPHDYSLRVVALTTSDT